jgi:hypothetical protein
MHEFLKQHIKFCIENKSLSIYDIKERLQFIFDLHFDLTVERLLQTQEIQMDGEMVSLGTKG